MRERALQGKLERGSKAGRSTKKLTNTHKNITEIAEKEKIAEMIEAHKEKALEIWVGRKLTGSRLS